MSLDVPTTEAVRYLMGLQELVRAPARLGPLDQEQQVGCCPSCPAQATGIAPTDPPVTDFSAVEWGIGQDPDQLLRVEPGMVDPFFGALHLLLPGLYTIHLQFAMTWELSTAGHTTWRLRSQVLSNDAGQGIEFFFSCRPAPGEIFVETTMFHFGHTALLDQEYVFDWELLGSLSDGVVAAGTGTLEAAELTVVRHSPGCATVSKGG